MPEKSNKQQKKLTIRERKFIDAYMENGGNAAQAYRVTHPDYKGKNAKQLGSRMYTKVDLSINELAEEMGLTDPIIVQKIIDGLSATKESGSAFQKKEITDYTAIVKYIDIALKLKGKYPSEKHDVKVEGELKITDARQKLTDRINNIIDHRRKTKTT